ncbi:hypothetical protein EK21DRAFT_110894 [Setomelanomma holmii]|uniref:Uncharacterized protein n=1 Tax=Setomelanomma holmii TaxID=210430 RepID=A0A9P4HBC5_9PLEO|nr:hypothetical protein EK21DRAFT_110894 [Setomelanomma holmii]
MGGRIETAAQRLQREGRHLLHVLRITEGPSDEDDLSPQPSSLDLRSHNMFLRRLQTILREEGLFVNDEGRTELGEQYLSTLERISADLDDEREIALDLEEDPSQQTPSSNLSQGSPTVTLRRLDVAPEIRPRNRDGLVDFLLPVLAAWPDTQQASADSQETRNGSSSQVDEPGLDVQQDHASPENPSHHGTDPEVETLVGQETPKKEDSTHVDEVSPTQPEPESTVDDAAHEEKWTEDPDESNRRESDNDGRSVSLRKLGKAWWTRHFRKKEKQ